MTISCVRLRTESYPAARKAQADLQIASSPRNRSAHCAASSSILAFSYGYSLLPLTLTILAFSRRNDLVAAAQLSFFVSSSCSSTGHIGRAFTWLHAFAALAHLLRWTVFQSLSSISSYSSSRVLHIHSSLARCSSCIVIDLATSSCTRHLLMLLQSSWAIMLAGVECSLPTQSSANTKMSDAVPACCKVLGSFVCLSPQRLDLIKLLLLPSYLSCREAEYTHRHDLKEFLGCFCLQGVVGKYR